MSACPKALDAAQAAYMLLCIKALCDFFLCACELLKAETQHCALEFMIQDRISWIMNPQWTPETCNVMLKPEEFHSWTVSSTLRLQNFAPSTPSAAKVKNPTWYKICTTAASPHVSQSGKKWGVCSCSTASRIPLHTVEVHHTNHLLVCFPLSINQCFAAQRNHPRCFGVDWNSFPRISLCKSPAGQTDFSTCIFFHFACVQLDWRGLEFPHGMVLIENR